jgi:glutamyl-tRNA synthetase
MTKILNPKSLVEYDLLAEEAIKDVKVGQTIQLERRGFYIVDVIMPEIVLINILDGKEKQSHLLNKEKN